MTPMKSPTEIQTEIARLRALKPIGPHASRTSETIALQIEELEHGIDQTAGEWWERDEAQRCAVIDAWQWKHRTATAPSLGWRGLAK